MQIITKKYCLALVLGALLMAGLYGLYFQPVGKAGDEVGGLDSLKPVENDIYIIQSAGHHSGKSRVMNVTEQAEVGLRRGLSLVGLVKNGSPVTLAHVDTCNPASAGTGLYPLESFKDEIDEAHDAFGAYVIAAHDSVVCGEDYDISSLMSDLGLNAWDDIGFRQPYVAVITPEESKEFLGPAGEVFSVTGDDMFGESRPVVQEQKAALPRVAHAGGGVAGKTYTNSFNALEENADKFALFEIDFSWTSDDELVCVHDWQGHFKGAFDDQVEGAVSLEEFEYLVAEKSRYQPCTLASLVAWLRDNPGKRVVTDIKEQNLEGLAMIADRFPELQERFIAQVYQPEEYFSARRLGYADIIWTLYRYPHDDGNVLAMLDVMDLYGLAMTRPHAERKLAARAKRRRRLLSWVHTINAPDDPEKFRKLGVDSIYTDWLPEGAL